MNGVHYFSERDFTRLEILEPFDVILCGKSVSGDSVQRLKEIFPGKRVGLYFMTLSELSPDEMRTYPGPMSDRVTGAGRVVGDYSDETVAWYVERAKSKIAGGGFLMSDNTDPRICPGYAPSDPKWLARRANWYEWLPKTVAAIADAIDMPLVANTGHSCNPASVGDPDLRNAYARFCAGVNGIGVEKKTGNPMASYTPSTFQGPYRAPRLSLAFAQDEAAWVTTDAMLLPPYVVKSVVKWVVVQGGV